VQDVELFSATPSYFGTLGIPLLQGRLFGEADRDSAPPVAIVNQAAARRYFGSRAPLGARITFDDPDDRTARWMTVIGVVGDIHHAALDEPPYPQVYLPLAQAPRRWMVLVARAAGRDPLALAPVMREVVRELDPGLALSSVATMDQRVASVTERPRLSAQVLGGFAAGALLLAALGIYGVVSYAVNQRAREFGIRLALGATSDNVVSLVVRRGARLTIVGLLIGLVGAFFVTKLIRSLLFGIEPLDPAAFATAAIVLGAFATLASWLPARRASRTDPVVTMRAEQ
jgi:putative ABC transport system permease protein